MGARKSEASTQAEQLVTVQGLSPYEAAATVGITRQAIYMSAWYKRWIAEQYKTARASEWFKLWKRAGKPPIPPEMRQGL